jgi:hypothetical protein
LFFLSDSLNYCTTEITCYRFDNTLLYPLPLQNSLWSVGRLVSWSVGRLVGWSVGRLVGWSVGRLVSWSVGRLVGWSVGRLVGWSAGWLVRRSVGRLVPTMKFLNLLTSKSGYIEIDSPSRLVWIILVFSIDISDNPVLSTNEDLTTTGQTENSIPITNKLSHPKILATPDLFFACACSCFGPRVCLCMRARVCMCVCVRECMYEADESPDLHVDGALTKEVPRGERSSKFSEFRFSILCVSMAWRCLDSAEDSFKLKIQSSLISSLNLFLSTR